MKFFTQEQIEKIRNGFYSAVYFTRTQKILLAEQNLQTVTMQIFQKNNATVCGVEEVAELLKNCTGYFEDKQWVNKWSEIKVEAVKDGIEIMPWEPVMHITGPYAYFAHLESVYLGILARRTLIATNTKKVVKAAGNKEIIFFADRFDYFANQEGDGYAATLVGVNGVATDAQGYWVNKKGIGTIPHALIAIHHGSTIDAASAFAKQYPTVPLITLVDFDNDCIKTSLEVATALKDKLYGIRIDTSEKLIDKSLQERADKGEQNLNGVNPQLIKNVRQALDNKGFNNVKIIVSGGFTAEKIETFEKESTPVDMYGVGSALLKGNNDYTADIVKVGDKEIAKVGRQFKLSKILQVIA